MQIDNIIFICGALLVAILIVLHYDPHVLAYLIGTHKAISVADDKFRDKIKDQDE